MDDATVWAYVDQQREDLADFLDTLSPQQWMRASVGNRRHPPGTTAADRLMDILVHGQDIAIPLGIERTMPIPAAVVAANRLWTMGSALNARKRFPKTRFVATDADFSVGEGAEIRGRIQDIVMTLSGRPAGLPLQQRGE
ncbi:hypothetical protein CQY20_29765 [Mycolicibacterium agri]|uniref:Mycothiol-dependent maleylpyruvate isomerase metal-binding domain-containing protein n=1 Tax=Mycolicibacterium agri TaxID=36811 RepID=A0A2A7MPJ7_MYCAG|nr:hypothetical protein [Mycolicibacterium agri]PEG33616.1 hypothetical protein CQY20_29765 [Mycolicibacterium agri]GFG51424.1 hypothetical protein MAGR_28650 [Mycolicibacterium agri]